MIAGLTGLREMTSFPADLEGASDHAGSLAEVLMPARVMHVSMQEMTE
jgi:hypothetical protein